jgi:hypothetical protein
VKENQNDLGLIVSDNRHIRLYVVEKGFRSGILLNRRLHVLVGSTSKKLRRKLKNLCNRTEIALTIGCGPSEQLDVHVTKDGATLLDLDEKIALMLHAPEAVSFAE